MDLIPNPRELIREGREISHNLRHKAYERGVELYVGLSNSFDTTFDINIISVRDLGNLVILF
jgi:hypothetical protein